MALSIDILNYTSAWTRGGEKAEAILSFLYTVWEFCMKIVRVGHSFKNLDLMQGILQILKHCLVNSSLVTRPHLRFRISRKYLMKGWGTSRIKWSHQYIKFKISLRSISFALVIKRPPRSVHFMNWNLLAQNGICRLVLRRTEFVCTWSQPIIGLGTGVKRGFFNRPHSSGHNYRSLIYWWIKKPN